MPTVPVPNLGGFTFFLLFFSGMRFGMMQIKIGLAQFISQYRAEKCNQTPDPPLTFNPKALLTSYKGGMYLKISKR